MSRGHAAVNTTMFGRKQEYHRTITQFQRPMLFAFAGPAGGMRARLELAADGTDLVTREEVPDPDRG